MVKSKLEKKKKSDFVINLVKKISSVLALQVI